jgi:hypothetical protein
MSERERGQRAARRSEANVRFCRLPVLDFQRLPAFPTATTAAAAATATTAASAATTTAAAAATATTKAAAATAATTTTAIGTLLRLVHAKGTTVEHRAVELSDRFGSLLICTHGHESKTARLTRLAIGHQVNVGHFADGGEGAAHTLGRRAERQVSDINTISHMSSIRCCGSREGPTIQRAIRIEGRRRDRPRLVTRRG